MRNFNCQPNSQNRFTMVPCLLVPADSVLYDAAKSYVDCIVSERESEGEMTSLLDTLRADSHRTLEALLNQHGIEYYDKQDVLDIAVQLCLEAGRSMDIVNLECI